MNRIRPILSNLSRRHYSGTSDSTGAYLEAPIVKWSAPFRLMLFVIPVGYLGTCISKNGAAFLEEYELFVPDDDDDDD